MLSPVLYAVAILYLTCALVGAIVVAADLTLYKQKVRVMNAVWPLSILYLGPVGLFFYYIYGRNKSAGKWWGRWIQLKRTPFWIQVFQNAMYTGAACALGALVGEALVDASGATLFGFYLLARYVADFVGACACAFLFEVMSRKHIHADFRVIAAFEGGMFALMGCTHLIFPDLPPGSWDYWFLMQLAMIAGLAAAYPVTRRSMKQ